MIIDKAKLAKLVYLVGQLRDKLDAMKKGTISHSHHQSAPPALTITGTPVLTGTVSTPYPGFTVAAGGGVPPYAYSLPDTALPAGLTLDASSGTVSGTPTTAQSLSNIVIRATDAIGETADLPAFMMTIVTSGAPLSISGTPVTTGTEGSPYAGFSVSGAGGSPPYAYSLHAGTLPPSVSLDPASGLVSGPLTVTGTQSGIVIRVTDSASATADLASFNVAVSAPTANLTARFGSLTFVGQNGVPVPPSVTSITSGNTGGDFTISGGMLVKANLTPGSSNYFLTCNDGTTIAVGIDLNAWDVGDQSGWDNQAIGVSNTGTKFGVNALPIYGANPALPATNGFCNIIFTLNPVVTNSVKIGATTYTFKAVETVGTDVALQPTAAATAARLAARINALPDPVVSAVYSLGASGQVPTVKVTALASGTTGNGISVSATANNIVPGAQACALLGAGLSGQTIYIRSGAVIAHHSKLQVATSSPISVISRDLGRIQGAAYPAQPWGTIPSLTGLATFVDDTILVGNAGMNAVIRGMRYAPSPMQRMYLSASASFVFDWNVIVGIAFDPTNASFSQGVGLAPGQFPNLVPTFVTNGFLNQSLTVSNNWFQWANNAIVVTPTPGGTLNITGNVLDGWYNGFIILSYPGADYTMNVSDNVAVRCASLSADRNNPHTNPIHISITNPPAASVLTLGIQRNRFFVGTARGNDWAVRFEWGGSGPLYYQGSYAGNVIAGLGSPANNDLEFYSPDGVTVINNTVAGDGFSNYAPVDVNLAEAGYLARTAPIGTRNVAEAFYWGTPATLTNNVALGLNGGTIPYATAFAGPAFTPTDLAGLMTSFAMKSGGPLDIGGIGVGAIGTGAVTWATTVPGSDGVTNV